MYLVVFDEGFKCLSEGLWVVDVQVRTDGSASSSRLGRFLEPFSFASSLACFSVLVRSSLSSLVASLFVGVFWTMPSISSWMLWHLCKLALTSHSARLASGKCQGHISPSLLSHPLCLAHGRKGNGGNQSLWGGGGAMLPT